MGRKRKDESRPPDQMSFQPTAVGRVALEKMAARETGGRLSEMIRAIIFEAAVRRGIMKRRKARYSGAVTYELTED